MAERLEVRIPRITSAVDSLVDTKMMLEIIQQELERARLHFSDFRSYHEGISVIREEYLELEHEVFQREQDRDKMRKESLHLAAMCLRFLEDLL
jgi:hypothetical protein